MINASQSRHTTHCGEIYSHGSKYIELVLNSILNIKYQLLELDSIRAKIPSLVAYDTFPGHKLPDAGFQ